jgi:protein tyrosine phosphatase (PTP) superfamily phosphohydrolase (DUF442 family)
MDGIVPVKYTFPRLILDHMTLLAAASGVANASSPLPWLVVGGQPTAAQLTALHGAGVRAIIDLRDPMEQRPFDEPAAAATLGMEYINAPVISGALADAAMDRVLAALRASRGAPTLLHCASANRTGGPLIAYLMLDESMDQQAAVDVAMRGGLRSVELLEWGTEYAERKRKG